MLNGDGLLGHLALSLNLSIFGLSAERSDSTRATSSAEAIAPANCAFTSFERTAVEINGLLVDRTLRVEPAARKVIAATSA